MSSKEEPVIDLRQYKDGFTFTGGQLKQKILEKIQQRLDPQVTAILAKLEALIPDKKKAVVYLAAFAGSQRSTDSLSPEAAEIWQLCRHLQNLTDDVGELQQIARNIYEQRTYTLEFDQLVKFGL